MPLVFSFRGYRFFFYSNEGDPREAMHIHVRKDNSLAKIWIEPKIQVAEAYGFSSTELTWLKKLVYNRRREIIEAWNEHFTI
jgi:hypothetical protein